MHILMLTPELPDPDKPRTYKRASILWQIESIKAAGIEVSVFEIKGSSKYKKYVQALPSFWVQLPKVDLIHAHYGYCAWLARMQMLKPVVVSFMGTDIYGIPKEDGSIKTYSKWVSWVNKRLLTHIVNAVIVKSTEMAEYLIPVKSHVIPNGVNMERFRVIDRQQARAALGWPEEGKIILFPGDPKTVRKGYPLAQAALRIVQEQLGEAQVEMVALEDVAPEQVPLYMNAADVMVMVSLKEGSPNVVKEALACNIPVVAVPVGDVVELLDGVDGCTICPRDAGCLAEALIHTLRTNQRINGREALKQKRLDKDSVVARLVEVYSSILDKGRKYHLP